jgi:hypothetical protein
MGFGQQKADVYGGQFGHLQSSWLQYFKMYSEISEHTTDFLTGVDAGCNMRAKFFVGSNPWRSLHQRLNDFGIDAPVAFLADIG